jgi:hypothetical protein
MTIARRQGAQWHSHKDTSLPPRTLSSLSIEEGAPRSVAQNPAGEQVDWYLYAQ